MNTSIINVAETFGLSEDQQMTGQSPVLRRRYAPERAKAIVEAAEMWKRTFDGDRRAALLVSEALSTSDLFKSVTGDVLDRELLAQYSAVTPQWSLYANRTTVRNFKPKKLVDLLGGRTALDLVPELTEYPAVNSSTAEYEIAVKKFGRRIGFSWEASINDDLDELEQIPSTFGQAASITEDTLALSLIANPDGSPNTAFFKSANGNTPVTKALTAPNVQAAVTAVSTKKDAEGNQVTSETGLILVVGKAQEFTAREILNATEIETTNGSKVSKGPNPLKGAIELVVLDRLAGTAWFVLPKPGSSRPALAVAFLRGWETPDLRIKSDAGNRLGGGAVSPEDGSFDDDSIYYRVRHVTGAATLVPLFTYASTGVDA